MKIYITRGAEQLGPFSLQELQSQIDKNGSSWLIDTVPLFWSDEEHVLPKGLQWDWDGRRWRVAKKAERTPVQEHEAYLRNLEYGRYLTELWKMSPEEAHRFANLLPPEREEEYNKSLSNDEREARRLRGLRPFISPRRYLWERSRPFIILALLCLVAVVVWRECQKHEQTNYRDPAMIHE